MYTLIDHELTPFSQKDEINAWLHRLREMYAKSPDDDGIRFALSEVEHIAEGAGILEPNERQGKYTSHEYWGIKP